MATVTMRKCLYHLTPQGCRYGTACRYSHLQSLGQNQTQLETQLESGSPENNPFTTRLCRFYLLPGGCRYGEACRFTHKDPESKDTLLVQPQNHSTETDEQFLQWHQIMAQQLANPDTAYGNKLAEYLQRVLVLVKSDQITREETIKLLSSEKSLIFIRELIDKHIPLCEDTASRIRIWRMCIRPLFKILTDTNVTSSNLLKAPLAVIHNEILGDQENRLRRLFELLLSLAYDWRNPMINESDGPKSDFLKLCTSTLERVVSSSNSLQAMTRLTIPQLAVQFAELVREIEGNEGTETWVLEAMSNLNNISKRLGIMQWILATCSQSKPTCGHQGPDATGEPCLVLLRGYALELPCGHILTSPKCHQVQQPESVGCNVVTTKVVPGCGHFVLVACHENVNCEDYECKIPCGRLLPCGHSYQQACGTFQTRIGSMIASEEHPPCTKRCPFKLACGHQCKHLIAAFNRVLLLTMLSRPFCLRSAMPGTEVLPNLRFHGCQGNDSRHS